MAEKNGNGSHPISHSKHGSSHVVSFDIKVLILNDDGSWFAQGLDMDYSAEGSTLKEAQERFEQGLERTILHHLSANNSLAGAFPTAPQEYWDTFMTQIEKCAYRFTSKLVIEAVESLQPKQSRYVFDLNYSQVGEPVGV